MSAGPLMVEKTLNPEEVAEAKGVNYHTVLRAIHDNDLAATKGRHGFEVTQTALAAWIPRKRGNQRGPRKADHLRRSEQIVICLTPDEKRGLVSRAQSGERPSQTARRGLGRCPCGCGYSMLDLPA